MNNLEWLYREDEYLNSFAKLMAMAHGYATDEFTANEWLMAQHEDANDDFTPESVVTGGIVDANDANDALDSREKLEADVRKWCGMYPYQVDMVWVWLNRQAEITEREIEKKWSSFSDSADGHIAELTNQLESAHAKNRALKAHIAKMQEGRHGWHIKGKELQQQVDTMRDVIREFRDERDHYIELFHEQERRANELQLRDANLAREIGTLRAERDRYRELCGKLLDAADDMRRVRDAFDQFERGEA